MNLNGTQRLYGLTGKNAWIINFRSSQTFNLVYTDISQNVLNWKMWLK